MADTLLLERVREINRDLEIRPATPGDGPAFTRLMNATYQRQKPVDYFQWMFFDAVIPATLFLAWRETQLVGCYGLLMRRLAGGLKVAFTIDLIIRPEFRGRGVFFILEEAATTFALACGAVAMTCLPNVQGMKAHLGLGDWKKAGTVRTLQTASIAIPTRVEQSAPAEEVRFQFESGPDYREWRFVRNPVYSYTCVCREAEAAYVKLFDPLDGARWVGDIVDYDLADKGQGLGRLIQNASATLFQKGAGVVATWALPAQAHRGILESLGFREVDQERFFCIKILDSRFDELGDFSRWHLVPADSEVF